MSLPSYAMSQPSFPVMYERELVGPLFRPWAEMTLDEVKLSHNERLLDLACGTGVVARLARERLGETAKIVGVDVSPDMLDVARAVAPDVDWREGNAAALPLLAGEQFDVVICQQGLQFFPDKPAAARQMRRAVAKDGRLAVTTWRSDEEIPFFRQLRDVAERYLGPTTDQRYSFGDGKALESLLRDAGFHEARSRTLSRTIRFENGGIFLRLNAMAFVGMSGAGKTMDDQMRKTTVDAIVKDSAPLLASYSDGSGIAFKLFTNLATAKG
jgi:ubiquinone/menaquinone biosynthesis C-methylase UbiE